MTWLIPLITGAGSIIGETVKGFFGVKQSQLQSIDKAVEVINSSNLSASEREKAIAAVIASETSSGYWLSAVWRPLFMLFLCIIVGAYCLGYTTPNLLAEMPEGSMMAQLFELLKIGVMGYMPLRTVDKVVEAFTRANVIKTIVEKLSK